MKPNKTNIRKWVEALRTPGLKQGRGWLRLKDDSVCCLGVLCEVARSNGVKMNISRPFEGKVAYDEAFTGLPESVATWCGIDSYDPKICGEITATTANDRLSWTFPQIADAIERTYLKEKDDA